MALELVEHRDEVIGEPKPVAEVLKARDGAVSTPGPLGAALTRALPDRTCYIRHLSP